MYTYDYDVTSYNGLVAEKVFMVGSLEKLQLQLYMYCRVCIETKGK